MRKAGVCLLLLFFLINFDFEAKASSISLDAGPGLAANLQCTDKKLMFSSSIPGLRTQDAVEGRAVAVILEAPDMEAEILVGKSERSTAGMRITAQVDASKLPITALSHEKRVTVTRLGDSVVIAPPRRAESILSVVGDCGKIPNLEVPASVHSVEVPADLSLEGERRWIVLASRASPTEAFDLLNTLRGQFADAQVLKAANGRFAVVAGPVKVSDTGALKARLIREKGAPADMFFTQGQNMVARIRQSTPSCRVQNTPDNALNLREEPSGRVVGLLNEGQKLSVSDQQTDQRGQLWLHARAQGGLTGWVYGKYVACDQAAR